MGSQRWRRVGILVAFIVAMLGPTRLADAQDAAPGCLDGPHALQIDHSFEDKGAEGGLVYIGRGEVSLQVSLTYENGVLSGTGAGKMKVKKRGRSTQMRCTSSRIIDIAWKFTGAVSAQCVVEFDAVRDTTPRSHVLICERDAGHVTIFAPEQPTQSVAMKLQLKAETGASVTIEGKEPDVKDVVKLTLVKANVAAD